MARLAGRVVLLIALVGAASSSGAQTYPQRPVRIIVNVTPGGGVDNVARIAAQHYHAVWGQPFIVDNRTGAGGSIGVRAAAGEGRTAESDRRHQRNAQQAAA